MDKLRQQLRELKNIQPEQGFSNRSKLNIFSTPQETAPTLTWRQFILGIVEYGGALALVAVLFVVIAGNTPLGKMLAPFDAGSLNSNNLRAEAEAIDIQIKLLDVDPFEEVSRSSSRVSTLATSSPKITAKESNQTTTLELSIATSEEIEATSTPVSPEEALRLLTK